MGREAICECRLGTESAEVKALLESTQLILRGAIRRSFAVSDLRGIEVLGERLCFQAGSERVELQLGAAEAALWARKLSTPPPTLAAKLGVGADRKAWVIGLVEDAALAGALADARAPCEADARLTVAVVLSEAELLAAEAGHRRLPCSEHLWIVHAKGRAAGLSDAVIRQSLRGLGYADSKTSAVSDRLTATRYSRR
jgi:hypothetical protein